MPTSSHRVCSGHFQGGTKTYLNTLPTKTPKIANQTPVHERKTERARNRGDIVLSDIQLDNACAVSVNTEPLLEFSMSLIFAA